MASAFAGIQVLELVRVAPGAFCTMMLADMGADVLKTEPWLWQNFCTAIGREDLGRFALHGEHFASVADSAATLAKQEVQEILRQKTRDEWCEFFKDKNVCVGPVYTVAETFQDSQVEARQMVRRY